MKQFDIHMTAADAYATEGARGIDTIQMMVKKQKGIDITLDKAQKMYDVKTEIFHSMPTAEIFPGVKEIMQKIKEARSSCDCSTTSAIFWMKHIS